MKKIVQSSVAAVLATAGLWAVVAMPASGSSKRSVTCYKLTSQALLTKKESGKTCPSGYSTTKPNLQGTNLAGDPDLTVPSNVTLNINGSSFDAPEVEATTSGTTAYSAGGKVSFSSYPAAGSGAGRTAITANPPTVNIGFSDQPMTATAGTLPSGATESNYVQVPYILGGAVVGYNLGSGINDLKLTSQEIAGIYEGSITKWSNPLIVNTNGGTSSTDGAALTALGTSNSAEDTIKVFYRSASSGTTYAFTDYLHQSGGSLLPVSGNVMEGSGNKWDAQNIGGAANNAAMASDILSTPGSIGYVEYSYLLIPGNAKIDVAQLQDKNGQWLTPSLANIAAAGTAAGNNITPDHFSIVDEPGNDVWPFATYSWAIVLKNQSDEATGEAVVKYLDWETHYAQDADAAQAGYVPLPAAVQAYARAQLATVTYNGTELLSQKS